MANVNGDLRRRTASRLPWMERKQYAAGMGIGVENTPSGHAAQVLFLADRSAVMMQAGEPHHCFTTQNGQLIIRDAVIGEGRLVTPNGNYIQSLLLDGQGMSDGISTSPGMPCLTT
ncbi:phage tail tip fiber protein [Enterobacter hormaechei]